MKTTDEFGDLDEDMDRQLLVLALTELAHHRPGWAETCRRLAARFEGGELFDKFGRVSRVKPDAIYQALVAAFHALKSYEYQNGSQELAASVAIAVRAALDELGGLPPGSPT